MKGCKHKNSEYRVSHCCHCGAHVLTAEEATICGICEDIAHKECMPEGNELCVIAQECRKAAEAQTDPKNVRGRGGVNP